MQGKYLICLLSNGFRWFVNGSIFILKSKHQMIKQYYRILIVDEIIVLLEIGGCIHLMPRGAKIVNIALWPHPLCESSACDLNPFDLVDCSQWKLIMDKSIGLRYCVFLLFTRTGTKMLVYFFLGWICNVVILHIFLDVRTKNFKILKLVID